VFSTVMRRTVVLAMLLQLLPAARAEAVLVYQHPDQAGNPQIVVAHDDGSQPRLLVSGGAPVLSPNGREVA